MKKKNIAGMAAIAMAVTIAATSASTNVFAYGETSGSSTLFTDTQNISDYSDWKDKTWNIKDSEGKLTREGEAYDSSKIILTPGENAKGLRFAWYSLEKGAPAVKVGKKADLSDAKEFKGTGTDGDENSRWSSQFSDNQWICLDLGSIKDVSKVVLKWEAAYGKKYNIQVSEDGNEWETVAVENNGDGDSDTLSFKHNNARFVKMLGIKRALG